MTATYVDTATGSDYAELSRLVRAARLLDRRRAHYVVRILITGAAFAAVWSALVLVGDSWYQTIVAVAMGVVMTQVAFLGHDGGHQQIARKRLGNDIAGLVAGNLLTGLSIGWWIDKHARHHANPNKEQHDPDIGESVFAFTTGAAARRAGRFGQLIVRRQALLFFPLLTLEGLSLHGAGLIWLGRGASKRRWIELALLVLHFAAYLTAVLLVLSPAKALAFVAINQAVFGFYMGCSFAPNHKGMAVVEAHERLDFLRKQTLTSRNVCGGWFVDQLLGGLNYQIEHHLFPNMPRPALRRAQPLVRAHCARHGIAYTETGLFRSYAMALQHLHAMGAPLRASR